MANQGQKNQDPQMGEREISPRSRPQLGGRSPPEPRRGGPPPRGGYNGPAGFTPPSQGAGGTKMHFYIHVLHILTLPLIVWVGCKKNEAPAWAFKAICGIGGVGLLYHIFRLVVGDSPPQSGPSPGQEQSFLPEGFDEGADSADEGFFEGSDSEFEDDSVDDEQEENPVD
jgi:hypothetical protein